MQWDVPGLACLLVSCGLAARSCSLCQGPGGESASGPHQAHCGQAQGAQPTLLCPGE